VAAKEDLQWPVDVPKATICSDFPPLRIHHFMIWTALTAVIIGGCMTFDGWARNGAQIEDRMIVAALVLTAVVVAGALTIVGSAYYWYEKGTIFPRSPGDMLLIAIAGAALGCFAGTGLLFLTFWIISDDDWFALYYFIVGVIVTVAWSYFQFAGIKRYANSWPWRVTFGILLIGPWIAAFLPIPVFIAFIASVLCASWVDWRKAIPRAWTHWCGVAFAILLGISLLCIVASVS
jgi:hypothetical protein